MGVYRFKTFTVEYVSELWDLGAPLRSSEDVWHWAYSVYRHLDADKEHFMVVCGDNKIRVCGHKVVSTGSLTATLVHPREVFMAVLNPDWRAAVFFIVHNHPSGDPQPSQEDIEITRRLREIAEVLGIKLQDHVVLGKDRFFSFSDRGML